MTGVHALTLLVTLETLQVLKGPILGFLASNPALVTFTRQSHATSRIMSLGRRYLCPVTQTRGSWAETA